MDEDSHHTLYAIQLPGQRLDQLELGATVVGRMAVLPEIAIETGKYLYEGSGYGHR